MTLPAPAPWGLGHWKAPGNSLWPKIRKLSYSLWPKGPRFVSYGELSGLSLPRPLDVELAAFGREPANEAPQHQRKDLSGRAISCFGRLGNSASVYASLMSMTSAGDYDWLDQFPFLSGMCCAPRQKLSIPGLLPEAFPSTEAIENGSSSQGSASGIVEETPVLKSEPNSGSEPDPVDIGSGDESAAAYTDPKLDSVPAADLLLAYAGVDLLPKGEVRPLVVSLLSYGIGDEEKRKLLEYAGTPGGRSECIEQLTTRVVEGEPRCLLPDAFATVQELMGQLMLDAMQREATQDLRALIKVSHSLTLITCEECTECDE
jgi:hypothetical protein